MKNNELKKLINNIAKEEKLYKLLVTNNKIGIRKIKQVIKEIFKKYETYYYIENSLMACVFYGIEIKTDKFTNAERTKLGKFNEFLKTEVMNRCYSIFDKDSVQDLTLFLIENRIDFFEKELIYNYDDIECSRDELEMLIIAAKSNTTVNIIEGEKIDYYGRYIKELNSSLEDYLKKRKLSK